MPPRPATSFFCKFVFVVVVLAFFSHFYILGGFYIALFYLMHIYCIYFVNCDASLRAGWSLVCSSIFQVLLKSV